jgi:hypothetical protein
VRRAALGLVSLLLLVWLWRDVDTAALGRVLGGLHPGWLAAALFLFVPTTLATAWRWQVVAADVRRLRLGEALRMVLAASAANLFLPAKLGDVGKGAFLGAPGAPAARAEGLALAFFEKLADVAALAAWMVVASLWALPEREAEQLAVVLGVCVVTGFALLCAFPVSGLLAGADAADDAEPDEGAGPLLRAARGVAALRAHPRRFGLVLLVSLGLWGLHLLQFLCAAWAAGAEVAPAWLASRIPMAIFVGLLPISFAGIGTRDAALVYLIGPVVGEPVALSLGAFATLRYLVPAAAGALSISGFGPSRGG